MTINYKMLALIVSTFIPILNTALPFLIKPVLSCLCVRSAHELDLQCDEISLKSQIANISIADEFAKHARLTRKLIKVQQELKDSVNSRLGSHATTKLILIYSIQAAIGFLSCIFIYFFKHIPVAVLPHQWLLPFNKILSWPTGVDGGISVIIWMFCIGISLKQVEPFAR